jgi:hypothetical protein
MADEITGLRHNEGKPRWALLPWDGLLSCVRVLEMGARKYSDRNWEGGLSWQETSECLLRHLTAWLQGEDLDGESGLDHTAHVLCNALFLATMVVRGSGRDDRPKPIDEECAPRLPDVVNLPARFPRGDQRVVYVAGPFRGPHHFAIAENIRNAERVALEIWKAGAVAICPHLNTTHFQGAADDSVWLTGDLEILRRCDAIALVYDWRESEGSIGELDLADELKLPAFEADRSGKLPAAFYNWLSGASSGAFVQEGSPAVDGSRGDAGQTPASKGPPDDAPDLNNTDVCYLCGRSAAERSGVELERWGGISNDREVYVCGYVGSSDGWGCHEHADASREINRLLAGEPRRKLDAEGRLVT